MIKKLIKKNTILYNMCSKVIQFKNTIMIKYFHKTASKYLYKKTFGRKLDLKNPQSFNEKIMWLKLNTYYNNELIKKCVDKLQVREYVSKKIGEKYLVPLLYTYDNEKEINWEQLPQQFALKLNTGSGYNIICSDKNKFEEQAVKKKLKKWLKEEYYLKYADYQYMGVKKKILCEKLIQKDITDYKFFCFNGKPEFFYVSEGFGDHNNLKIGYFDLNKKNLNIKRAEYEMLESVEIDNLDKMLDIARKLSEDFPFVRVDLYNVEGKIYFSELTFIPTGGLMKIEPESYDYKWGKILKLPKNK